MGCALLLACHVLALMLPAQWNKNASNFMFVTESVFANVSLLTARRRAEGVIRTYWLLFSLARAVFGIANLIWLAQTTLQLPGSCSTRCCFSIAYMRRRWR